MKRVIKVHETAAAGLEIGPEAAKLAGSRENFFFANDRGCYIVGPISILTETQNIRVSANYRMPTPYELAIPSTIVTPQPVLIENSPVEGFSSIAEEIASLLGELA